MIKEFSGDISKIKDLLADYKKSIGEEPLASGQLKKLELAVARGEITFFVCYKYDKPIGMCSVSRTFSTFNCEYSGVFEDFYVRPEYRGQGIAKSLVEFVFKYCDEHKIATLWVGCAQCDVGMYKQLGFRYPLGNLLTWVNNKIKEY